MSKKIKNAILLLLISCAGLQAQAQEEEGYGTELGFRAGFIGANICDGWVGDCERLTWGATPYLRFSSDKAALEIHYTFSGDIEATSAADLTFGGVRFVGADAAWSYRGAGIMLEPYVPDTIIFLRLGLQSWASETEYNGPLGASFTLKQSARSWVLGGGIGGKDRRIAYDRIFNSDGSHINYLYVGFDF